MLTGFFGAVAVYVIIWYVILPFWANYQTIKWNERSRGQHRYLYRTRPTPKPEARKCALFMKDCDRTCEACNPPEETPTKGPYR